VEIKFDASHVPENPTIVLMTKGGKRIGKLPSTRIHFRDCLNSYCELQFDVYKEDCDKKIWDNIKDFRLVYVKEWDNKLFEISVEYDDSDSERKSVRGISLGESELSQIKLFGIEINTETDLEISDYQPTTLYNETDSSLSLIDRLSEKIPHYTLDHVDDTIKNIQRTFQFNDITIYDAFQEIAEQIGCIFIIQCYFDATGIKRKINIYDMESYCEDCHKRGEFVSVCDECGGSNIRHGYGNDTTIYISKENLADEIVYKTDVDSVKNCFRLEAGDDLMTAAVINCNPSGSQYLWCITDEMKDDMSDALKNKIEAYQSLNDYYDGKTNTDHPEQYSPKGYDIAINCRSYNTSFSYAKDDYVLVNGTLYKCILAHEGAYGIKPGETGYETYWEIETDLEVAKIAEAYQNYISSMSIYDAYLDEDNCYGYPEDGLENLPPFIHSYQELLKVYFDVIDRELFFTDVMAPKPDSAASVSEGASDELSDIVSSLTDSCFYIALNNPKNCSIETVSNAVVSAAKVFANTAKYQIKATASSYDTSVPVILKSIDVKGNRYYIISNSLVDRSGNQFDGTYTINVDSVEIEGETPTENKTYQTSDTETFTWSGVLEISSYTDDSDKSTSETISIKIYDDEKTYARQRIDAIIGKKTDGDSDIVSVFNKELNDFADSIRYRNLSDLKGLLDICQSCLDVLVEQGIADKKTWDEMLGDDTDAENLYNNLYIDYRNKLSRIGDFIEQRTEDIETIKAVKTCIEDEIQFINDSLNIGAAFGGELSEFLSFRREDVYKNENYISDGLNNSQLFENATEFLSAAKKEIYKSANYQHSITASLKNLLVMEDFKPILSYFETGNWLRIRVGEQLYKLRLVEYSIDFDNISNISITFSDVKTISLNAISDLQSIASQAQSIASSYSYVAKQADKGSDGKKKIDGWVSKGIDLTNMKIVGDADDQNITWDDHGILCRRYSPITETYSDNQLKIVNSGLYVTNDNWVTAKAGIGRFLYYDPKTGETKEGYGVVADKLVANIVLAEEMGIYTKDNYITIDEDGFIITSESTENRPLFVIRKKVSKLNNGSESGDEYEKLVYIDSNGNVVINGNVKIGAELETSGLETFINKQYDKAKEYSDNELGRYKTRVSKYLNFDSEKGLIIGQETSPFKTFIDNEEMSFWDSNNKVASISNKQLFIANAVISDSSGASGTLKIGGYFAASDNDGAVRIYWRGNG